MKEEGKQCPYCESDGKIHDGAAHGEYACGYAEELPEAYRPDSCKLIASLREKLKAFRRGRDNQERVMEACNRHFIDAVAPILHLWPESQRPPGICMIVEKVQALCQELAEERRGFPCEQAITDLPMDRQIVLLNRQLAAETAKRERVEVVLRKVLASAQPRATEHPAMFAAFQEAQVVLEGK